MASLVHPSRVVQESFLEAVSEAHEEGRRLRLSVAELRDSAAYDRYLQALLWESSEDPGRPNWIVPQSTFWWVDGTQFIGWISIRHRLTDQLRAAGGHIGYETRPSERGKGHATAMLAAALPKARQLGIERALLTCDEYNVASMRVIEKNGGILESTPSAKMRYWVDTR